MLCEPIVTAWTSYDCQSIRGSFLQMIRRALELLDGYPHNRNERFYL